MITDDRKRLVAVCRIDCALCELNMCKYNPQLLVHLISKGIPKEELPCAGRRDIKGHCPAIGVIQCATYVCATEKGIDFCYNCGDFPCTKLQPSADRADVLPHNTKVFNLCTVKRIGVENFVKVSSEIKERYYRGKMVIGNGPQIDT